MSADLCCSVSGELVHQKFRIAGYSVANAGIPKPYWGLGEHKARKARKRVRNKGHFWPIGSKVGVCTSGIRGCKEVDCEGVSADDSLLISPRTT